jgi:hypothetical protein
MALMMNLVDAIAATQHALLKAQGKDAQYTPHDGAAVTVRAYIRGVRAQDLFASAVQQDVAAILDAKEFLTKLPTRTSPARFDRLRTVQGRTYSIEEWRGSPENNPVFFKLLLRGGQQ